MRVAAISLLLLPLALLGARLRSGPSDSPAGALTLETIFGGETLVPGLPEGLLWLPDGSGLLYRETQDGVTRLVRHDVAGGETRRLLDWEALMEELKSQRPDWSEPPLDDVNRTGRFRFDQVLSPDGRTLVGVAHGDLFAVELESGAARYLTAGGEPESFFAFSEDGRRLGFARDGDLYWIDVASGEEWRVTDRGGVETLLNGVADWVYEEELAVRRSWWWSPDGRSVAFLQYDTSPIPVFPITDDMELIPRVERQRYPKAGGSNSRVRLGVVSASGGEPVWIAAAADEAYLPRAGWTPDGGVWYQWLSRAQDRLELRLADADGGAMRTLVTEQDRTWVNVADDLRFVGSEQFLWSSERDGWRHLYLYSRGGELRRQLTSGAWQVEGVLGTDSEQRHVFFQATERDPRERHLYRVRLAGGPIERLSGEDGTWTASLGPGGSHLAATHSSLSRPPQLELLASDGRRVRRLAGGPIAALEEQALPPVELGSLETADGETLYTAMIRPPDFDPGRRHPVLLYVYGGPHAQTVTDAWFERRQLFFQFLAQQGLVVFWLDNRGSWGRGHAFESAVHRKLGERELADQLEGLAWLERQPWVDPDRIGVYGGSYGGYMALTCLFKAPERFRAGIAYAPVTDWRLYDTIYTERYMGTPETNPEGYAASAPLGFAHQLQGRLLLIHGASDNNVHMQNSLQLSDRLSAAGRTFDMLVYPRVRHAIRTSRFKLAFHQRKWEFLKRHLLEPAAAP